MQQAELMDRAKIALRTGKRRVDAVRHRGEGVECPACGRGFRRFSTYRGRANAECPGCGAMERHRLLWTYLRGRPRLRPTEWTLHFAPERQIVPLIRAESAGPYVGVDLKPGFDVQLDITRLPFRDGAFARVLCCHVLEHIPDDRAAMRELRRVVSDAGQVLVQVPIHRDDVTDEDFTLSSKERARRYGQSDHVRVYGGDVVDRLTSAMFTVEEVSSASIEEAVLERGAIPRDESLFVCTPA